MGTKQTNNFMLKLNLTLTWTKPRIEFDLRLLMLKLSSDFELREL